MAHDKFFYFSNLYVDNIILKYANYIYYYKI